MASYVSFGKNGDETQENDPSQVVEARLRDVWRYLQNLGDDEWQAVANKLGEGVIADLSELFGPEDPADDIVKG